MNIVNIMNFVRGLDPRHHRDLIKPLKNQIELNKKYGFENTFLLTYDAFINPEFSDILIEARDDAMEIGIWVETCRQLTESVGIAWRGRPGFDCEMYVDPGYLPAYTDHEKELMIDEIMEKFREVFGEYPKTAGSWIIDAHSMRYMSEKYNIRAFGICREQLSVDAYTLWGGPYNQPYYPSVKNMLSPAQTAENQINTPVFRLLGIEPIRGYNQYRYANAPECRVGATMEPVYHYGRSEHYMRWFFETFFENENLGVGYTQVGQENTFGWEAMEEGIKLQYALVDEYAKAGKIKVMKMCDAGELFSKTFKSTPPVCISAERDPVKTLDYRSIWYSCKNYRMNIFLDKGMLYFRDIMKFDENYEENYAHEPCRQPSAEYDTLPVVDERCWSGTNLHEAGLDFDGKYVLSEVDRDDDKLVISAKCEENGSDVKILLDENSITVCGGGTLRWHFGNFKDYREENNTIYFKHNGFDYKACVEGELTPEADGFNLEGEVRKFIFA